jgi:ubiquitin carboxyl-terminal hydrolase 34
MRCGGCQVVRSVEEGFFSYGVGVKGQDSLLAAIEAMQRGEVISDYKCDNCNEKHDMHRRTLLGTLPNNLLVSLQRIVFDMDTFCNVKIHSKL